MLVILNSLNANNFPIFQHILMILVSKFMFIELFLVKYTYRYHIRIIRVAVSLK